MSLPDITPKPWPRNPQIGDVVVSNYGYYCMEITHILVNEEGMHFTLKNPDDESSRDNHYINNFEMREGYCRRRWPWPKGSSGESSNHGGLNGDRFDYISLVESAKQGSLF